MQELNRDKLVWFRCVIGLFWGPWFRWTRSWKNQALQSSLQNCCYSAQFSRWTSAWRKNRISGGTLKSVPGACSRLLSSLNHFISLCKKTCHDVFWNSLLTTNKTTKAVRINQPQFLSLKTALQHNAKLWFNKRNKVIFCLKEKINSEKLIYM